MIGLPEPAHWQKHEDAAGCEVGPPTPWYSAEQMLSAISTITEQAAAVPAEVAGLAKALQFYADGNHRTTLTNIPRRSGFDWDDERKKLNDSGFFKVCENSNGSEDFVEDGSFAAEALAAPQALPASGEAREPLTNEQLAKGHHFGSDWPAFVSGARFAENMHGIAAPTTTQVAKA